MEIYIIGRESLPPHAEYWNKLIGNQLETIEIYEVNNQDCPGVLQFIKKLDWELGFNPKSIIKIRKALDGAYAIAFVISESVAGIIFDDYDGALKYDSKNIVNGAESIGELEGKCKIAFDNPDPYLVYLSNE